MRLTWERTCFPTHSDHWQNPIPCSCGTEGCRSLLAIHQKLPHFLEASSVPCHTGFHHATRETDSSKTGAAICVRGHTHVHTCTHLHAHTGTHTRTLPLPQSMGQKQVMCPACTQDEETWQIRRQGLWTPPKRCVGASPEFHDDGRDEGDGRGQLATSLHCMSQTFSSATESG